MANAYGLFWNSVSSDRVYDADSFAEWLNKFFTTGLFNGELQVLSSGGMVVEVQTGYANINGKVRFFDTPDSITLDPAGGTYPRIDTIVVERNDTNREILLYLSKGYRIQDMEKVVFLSLSAIKRRIAQMKELFEVSEDSSLVKAARIQGFI